MLNIALYKFYLNVAPKGIILIMYKTVNFLINVTILLNCWVDFFKNKVSRFLTIFSHGFCKL